MSPDRVLTRVTARMLRYAKALVSVPGPSKRPPRPSRRFAAPRPRSLRGSVVAPSKVPPIERPTRHSPTQRMLGGLATWGPA